MNYYEQLQEILCTDESIEKQLRPYLFKNEIDTSMVNDIEERHLRMYCENLNWDYLKQRMDWDFEWIPQWKWEVNDRIFWLDNTKPFHQQTEEVYKSIVEFLEDNK